MTNSLTSQLSNNVRYIRFIVTAHAASPATITQQGLYEKHGRRKWLAILLRKPISEWRDLPSEYEK